MPTVKFEVADHEVAVEPWSPIERRIVLRSTADGNAEPDEATLLFTANRTETGAVTNVDGDGGVSVWAYFDLDDFDDVLHLLESDDDAYFHYGHVSGSGSARSLYFVSVETTPSVPGRSEDGAGVESSLPFGAHDGEESLELPVETSEEGSNRVRERNPKRN